MPAVYDSPVRALSSLDIVKVWELGQNRPSWYKALILLSAALPDWTSEEVAKLSVGDRNAFLFSLREVMIGLAMDAYVKCPKCNEPLEFELEISDFCQNYQHIEKKQSYSFYLDEMKISYRLLNTLDLIASMSETSLEDSRLSLIKRSILKLERNGKAADLKDLESSVIQSLSEEFVKQDSLVDKRLPLVCAACEYVWPATFDIVKYFWVEIEHLAKNLLDDTLVLGKSCGWSQEEVLMMSPIRRKYYLDSLGD